MSCGSCNCVPCECDECCDPENEPLSSTLNNFISEFFGSVEKACVNEEVTWTLPCDLSGTPFVGYPRVVGEGLACYFARVIPLLVSGGGGGDGHNLIDLFSNISANGDTHLLIDSTGDPTVDWEVRTLMGGGALSVDWNSRYLYNTSGAVTVDWENQLLYDSVGVQCLNFGTRILRDSAGVITLSWDTLDLTGDWTINGNTFYFQTGSQAITVGLDLVTVVFPTAFGSVPKMPRVSIARPAGGNLIYANVNSDSVTVNGFTADLSQVAPDGTYTLNWEANV